MKRNIKNAKLRLKFKFFMLGFVVSMAISSLQFLLFQARMKENIIKTLERKSKQITMPTDTITIIKQE